MAALTSYRMPDGSTQERLFVATIEGPSISRLTYYRLPLGAEPAVGSVPPPAGGDGSHQQ
jgi:hypothetical protein